MAATAAAGASGRADGRAGGQAAASDRQADKKTWPAKLASHPKMYVSYAKERFGASRIKMYVFSSVSALRAERMYIF